MNALYVIHKYLEIKAGRRPSTPITVIFGAKAAPAYVIAKDIILSLIHIWIKAMNESIYYNIDKLHAAIASNQQILFKYFEWTIDKTIRLKKDGSPYQVSPWALTWDDENYYLIGFDMDAGMLKHFRVDKMLEIELLEEPRSGREEFGRFDLAHYAKKTFGMFGGEEETLRIRFHNKYIGVVIDRFGKDVSVRPDGEQHFIARVEVAVSEDVYKRQVQCLSEHGGLWYRRF